jgi:hypothetical protein
MYTTNSHTTAAVAVVVVVVVVVSYCLVDRNRNIMHQAVWIHL